MAPSRLDDAFEERIAKALGPQGGLAMGEVSLKEKLVPYRLVRKWAIAAAFVVLLGIAGASYYFQVQFSQNLADTPVADVALPAESSVAPLASLPDVAEPLPPVDGDWRPLDHESVLVEVRDEGIVREPSQPPALQYRYRFHDTTTFTGAADNSEMRMTVPREQVFQVKLQAY